MDNARDKQSEVLFNGVGSPQQQCSHGVASGSRVVGVVCKSASKVETPIATIHLILCQPAIAEIHSIFNGVVSAQIRETDSRVVSIFKTNNGQGTGLANAGIACRTEDRNAIGIRPLVGTFHAQFLTNFGPRRGTFLTKIEVEPIPTHLHFHDVSWGPGSNPTGDNVKRLQGGIASKSVLITQTELSI